MAECLIPRRIEIFAGIRIPTYVALFGRFISHIKRFYEWPYACRCASLASSFGQEEDAIPATSMSPEAAILYAQLEAF